jgi:hypothetical protein
MDEQIQDDNGWCWCESQGVFVHQQTNMTWNPIEKRYGHTADEMNKTAKLKESIPSSKSSRRTEGKHKIVLINNACSVASNIFGGGMEGSDTSTYVSEGGSNAAQDESIVADHGKCSDPQNLGISRADTMSASLKSSVDNNGRDMKSDDMAGWTWNSELSLYIHRDSRVSWNPTSQQYGTIGAGELMIKWNDEKSFEASGASALNTPPCAVEGETAPYAGEGEAATAIKPDQSCSDSDSVELNASGDEDAPSQLSGDIKDSSSSDDLDGEEWQSGVEEQVTSETQVCGDWIWDGEFWVTADGLSYHPGLGQYFRAGQRIWLREEDKPAPDADRLHERWVQDRYILDYGGGGADGAAGQSPAAGRRELRLPPPPGGGGEGGGVHRIGSGGATLGKSRTCSVYIRRPSVSRRHAQAGPPPAAPRATPPCRTEPAGCRDSSRSHRRPAAVRRPAVPAPHHPCRCRD